MSTHHFQAVFESGRRMNLRGDSLIEAHADLTHIWRNGGYLVGSLKETTTGGATRVWRAGETELIRIEHTEPQL